jgi:hypothetical protein
MRCRATAREQQGPFGFARDRLSTWYSFLWEGDVPEGDKLLRADR